MTQKKPSRNDPCPCGSGKKWKKCCGDVKPKKIQASVLSSPKSLHSIFSKKTQLSSDTKK